MGPPRIQPGTSGPQTELRAGARSRAARPIPSRRSGDSLLRCELVRDATLVSVLAYAGLRPGEAFALNWVHVRECTLLVEAAVSLGQVGETKTRRRRAVRLLPPLAQDLAEWRLRAGRRPAHRRRPPR
jgi:integrase